MRVRLCGGIVFAALLLLGTVSPVFAFDRYSGPAGAEGIGLPGGALGGFSPFHYPAGRSGNVSGNSEFRRSKNTAPVVREERGNTTPRAWDDAVFKREPVDADK